MNRRHSQSSNATPVKSADDKRRPKRRYCAGFWMPVTTRRSARSEARISAKVIFCGRAPGLRSPAFHAKIIKTSPITTNKPTSERPNQSSLRVMGTAPCLSIHPSAYPLLTGDILVAIFGAVFWQILQLFQFGAARGTRIPGMQNSNALNIRQRWSRPRRVANLAR